MKLSEAYQDYLNADPGNTLSYKEFLRSTITIIWISCMQGRANITDCTAGIDLCNEYLEEFDPSDGDVRNVREEFISALLNL